jgi:ATPase subunit of ABC transporter with duplicated ATPase domains
MLASLQLAATRVVRRQGATHLLRHRHWTVAANTNTNASLLFRHFASGATHQVMRAKDITFGYGNDESSNLLEDVNFSIQEGSKVTIMGQNGSGKSTIIKLLNKTLRPSDGQIIVRSGERVATALQTMPMECRDLTVKDFLKHQLTDGLEDHEVEAKMSKALNDVLLLDDKHLTQVDAGHRIVKSFSGGQQARLLLAAALIQNPSILLLDEPTNNLDDDGLWHLQSFIQETDKTCVVISHDEDFLNSFTDQVLYLDLHSKQVETYQGDYFVVKNEISKRIKRENAANALLQKKAQVKKDQAGKFANKGGGLRKVAKTMRGVAADMEAAMVDVRREDEALRDFSVPFRRSSEYQGGTGPLLSIAQVSSYQRASAPRGESIQLRKGSRVQVCGPNGIGKTTFLEMIVAGTAPGVILDEGATVGYYRQDFSNFDFDSTVLTCLEEASNNTHTTQEIRKTAAAFLLRGGRLMQQQVKTLSEGQKGLLSLACLHLQQPSILIMDEPTNHINFRHLPALAKAVKNFEGAVLLVSHDYHFVQDVKPDIVIDMGEELAKEGSVEHNQSITAQ